MIGKLRLVKQIIAYITAILKPNLAQRKNI